MKIRRGLHLPHWTCEGATYAVTFRLADSLPHSVLEAWLFERQNIIRTAEQSNRPLSDHERRRLQKLHSERVETYLDAGHGECWLRQPRVAQLVADALRHFDRQRYLLHAWCIMPNHVHAILEPLPGNELPAILHSWKSFTAKSANRLLGRSGDSGRRNTTITSSATRRITRMRSITSLETLPPPDCLLGHGSGARRRITEAPVARASRPKSLTPPTWPKTPKPQPIPAQPSRHRSPRPMPSGVCTAKAKHGIAIHAGA